MIQTPEGVTPLKATAELTAHQNRFIDLPKSCQNLLGEIYGDQINHYEGFLKPNQADRCTSIFNGFFSAALDSGALQDRIFDKQITKGSVAFRRGSFVDLISKKAGIKEEDGVFSLEKNISMQLFDIKDFRQYDLVKDTDNNSYADVLINQIVQVGNTALEKTGLSEKAYMCRYGGDEFLIGGVGLTTLQMEQLIAEVKSGISKLKGKYLDPKTGNIISDHTVELNESKQQDFDCKTSEITNLKQDVFLSYFQKGLLLDHDELEKVLKRYATKGNVIDKEGEAAIRNEIQQHDIYDRENPIMKQEGKSEIEKKIEYICADNPQLGPVISLAQLIDAKESNKLNKTVQKRTESILSFIEKVMYDPLLEHNIYSFTDFAEHLQNQKFEMIRVVDMKFIKEINDKFSIVEGDEAIKTVWNKLNTEVLGSLDQKTRSKLRIGRRGGTFFIGMDAHEKLVPDEQKVLQDLLEKNCSNIDIDIRGEKANVPLGLSENILAKEQKNPKDLNKVIGEAMTSAEIKWYNDIIAIFGKEKMKEYIGKDFNGDPKLDCSSLPEGTLQRNLINDFFNGKRRNERIAKLQELI